MMSKIISLQINAVVLITFLSTILLHLLALLNATLQRTKNYHGKSIIASAPGTVFTRIHFLWNLQIGPMSKSVCHWQAFPA
jgi:hypothetical protein